MTVRRNTWLHFILVSVLCVKWLLSLCPADYHEIV